MKIVRVRVEGRVQGVAYRAWTKQTAHSLGLTGWVRNRSDGSVEAMFCGEEVDVARMLDRCSEGPPAAGVSAVRILAEDEDAPPLGFRTLRTE